MYWYDVPASPYNGLRLQGTTHYVSNNCTAHCALFIYLLFTHTHGMCIVTNYYVLASIRRADLSPLGYVKPKHCRNDFLMLISKYCGPEPFSPKLISLRRCRSTSRLQYLTPKTEPPALI